ncbi:MAG: class I SAM-dependent methyltransferase [Spirochaetota bacterium]
MSEDRSAAPDCLHRILAGLRAGEVLDVGCGSGSFTRTLADTLTGARSIMGIDPDKDSVDEARRLTDDWRVRFRVLAGGDAPFGDERFDLVAISNALHHLEDPRAVLHDLRRMVRPGGYLVVQELVSDELAPAEENGRDLHHFKARIDRLRGRSHEPTLTRSAVRELVRSSGGVVEEECEIHEPVADDEAVDEALAFLAEYLPFAEGTPDYDDLAGEAQRLAARLPAHGVVSPPRLLIRARYPRTGAARPARRG